MDNKLNNQTPLMRQYQEIKDRYPFATVFFRLGDFYEMFGNDAIEAAPILEVTLTKRTNTPMCGVPYHAINGYLQKLVKAGKKIAICEQLEEPGAGKKIVKRDVVRLITPGTILEDNLLTAKVNNYLAALCFRNDTSQANGEDEVGVAFVDISTGEFFTTQASKNIVLQELAKTQANEILISKDFTCSKTLKALKETQTTITQVESYLFSTERAQEKIKQSYKIHSLKPFGLDTKPLSAGACAALLAYIENTQLSNLPNLSNIRYYSLDNFMSLDEAAIKNLELVRALNTQSTQGSLLEVIDKTLTPMGARMLRSRLLKPLLILDEIKARQSAVEFFVENTLVRKTISEYLKKISDIERILGRIASNTANPRELLGLKTSLDATVEIKQALIPAGILSLPKAISEIKEDINIKIDVALLIEQTINPEPPINFKMGGIIKTGFNTELDELNALRTDTKKLISEIETTEKQKTGITSLKVGYTSVYGYYIEITKSYLHLTPQHYIRKQTVTGGERFITPELKAFEEKVLTAEDKIIKLELFLFNMLKQEILTHTQELRKCASAIAELDFFVSLSWVAALNNYVKPQLNDSLQINITDGRHAVIEKHIKSGSFVPNDTLLDGHANHLMLITGPNMAGKSTYLRQVALICILAQIGSFVPAQQANLSIVDKIFTRIGSGDNLAGGESTFMVEMRETAHILNQFTQRSLIILDEVGRGTSTYDGISIAKAVVEYLNLPRIKNGAGPKVLFATHYFELTNMAQTQEGITNFNIEVKEWQGEVIFLHKIIPGAADRSYGIHVAKLAGLPDLVIKKASKTLAELETKLPLSENNIGNNSPQLSLNYKPIQVKENTSFLSDIMLELKSIDLENITPIEAFKYLLELKNRLTKEE